MKQRFILLFLLSLLVERVVAQMVSGKVMDANNSPLCSASVILKSLQDTSSVFTTATNADGEFALSVKYDNEYSLQISYVGYKNVYLICKAGDTYSIVMKGDSKYLKGTQIVASRVKPDANGYTVYLKGSDIIKGKVTSDALMFLPGITKEEGIYKVNGLQVSDIYVDGVRLPSLDELGNISADMIDKVKVNLLAGSNQNAMLTGGTIEIFLKQPIDGGYYGSLMADGTVYPSYGFSNERLGGVVSGRYKNLCIYNNLSFDFNQPKETAEQTIGNDKASSVADIGEIVKSKVSGVRNRFSIMQQLSANSNIGGSYYIATNNLNVSSSTSAKDASVISMVDNRNHFLDQEVTLKGTLALTNKTTLECVGDFFNRHSSTKSDFLYNSTIHTKSEDKYSLRMYRFSVDFMTSHCRTIAFKYGASIQYITSEYIPVGTVGNSSERFNTSYAAGRTSGLTPFTYLSVMGQVGKLMYSGGVNLRYNRIMYKALPEGEISTSNQFGINPQVQMMMPLDKLGRNTLMLNYKRTLDDIPYSAISTVINWSDSYNYTVGNPDLKSPYADIVMAGVALLNNTINVNTIYIHSRNSIYWETRKSSTASDVFYTIPVNLPGNDMYGLGVEVNCKPAKYWNMKISSRLESHPEDITLGGVAYRKKPIRQYYTVYNTYSLEHGWGGMLNMMLEPTFKSYDRTYHTVYNVGGQIYKSMCKDKFQFTFLFNAVGNRRKYDRQVNGCKITYNNNTSVQNIGLSLLWRFAGGKNTNIRAIENATQSYKEIIDVK